MSTQHPQKDKDSLASTTKRIEKWNKYASWAPTAQSRKKKRQEILYRTENILHEHPRRITFIQKKYTSMYFKKIYIQLEIGEMIFL